MDEKLLIKLNRKVIFAVFFLLWYIAFAVFLSYRKGYSYMNFEFLCHVGIGLFCGIILLLIYLVERNRHSIFDPVFKTYLRLFVAGLIATIGVLPLMFLPDYVEPFVSLPVVISMMFTPFIGSSVSALSILMYATIYGLSIYKLFAYLILCFLGAISGNLMKKKGWNFWGMVIILSVNAAVHALFYFLEHHALSLAATYAMAFNTLATLLFISVCARMFRVTLLRPENAMIEKCLKGDYPLFAYLQTQGDKFVKQSLYCGKISRDLGKLMQFPSKRCEAAGLYYRLEEIDDSLHQELVLPVWAKHSLPEKVNEILYEAKGVRRKPQTPESAMVYIIYECIRDLDLQGPDPNKPKREIDIHRITNNVSSSGILDESGLSMNQFLTLKNLLVQYLEKGL